MRSGGFKSGESEEEKSNEDEKGANGDSGLDFRDKMSGIGGPEGSINGKKTVFFVVVIVGDYGGIVLWEENEEESHSPTFIAAATPLFFGICSISHFLVFSFS